MAQFFARIEIADKGKDFESGLLIDLIAALKQTHAGEHIAITSTIPTLGDDLDRWARLTGNSIVASTREGNSARYVIRHGRPPAQERADEQRPLGSRLWLYTNFDCNLACDYCCVRSSPATPRRELGLERIRRIAAEAPELGVRELFVTGGEPFLLPDIGEILRVCSEAAPTTVLTNGMLFRGKRLRALTGLPRSRLTLQISLDSPDPHLHDKHRGAGTWQTAWEGARIARAEGFRVRLAATVDNDDDAMRFEDFLDRQGVAPEDRVIRRVALRGFAHSGVAFARADLLPEMTITDSGVFWHPVGADDRDLFVTSQIFPLREAFNAVRTALEGERRLHNAVLSIFHCA